MGHDKRVGDFSAKIRYPWCPIPTLKHCPGTKGGGGCWGGGVPLYVYVYVHVCGVCICVFVYINVVNALAF